MRTQHYEAKRVNKHLIKPVRLVLKELKFVNKNYNYYFSKPLAVTFAQTYQNDN